MSDPTKSHLYRTFARTIPATSTVSKPLIALMREYHWTSFTLVVGQGQSWQEAADTVTALAEKYGIRVNQRETFKEPYNIADTPEELADIVTKTKSKTRSKFLMFSDCFMQTKKVNNPDIDSY